MKKILFLGAAAFQHPPIQYALKQGYKVITADNIPANPCHQLAAKSYNVSTTDKEGILAVAQKENIDGILTFASDVSMPAVAYVAEKMNLPAPNSDTVLRLTNKALFRQFLQNEGLQTQFFQGFEAHEKHIATAYIRLAKLPIIVKPVDRSGSRGVGIVRTLKEAEQKVEAAFDVSIKKQIIVEQYIEKQGQQVCGDGYMEKGKLVFVAFGDGYFYPDACFMAPYAETFPSGHPLYLLERAKQKLEAILQRAGYHQGSFNLDVFITKDNQVFVNEIGPRCGGNFIPLLIQLTYGVDLVAGAVEGCLDAHYKIPLLSSFIPKAYYASYMIHSLEKGDLKEIQFDNSLKGKIHAHHPYVGKVHQVRPFFQGGAALGNVIFRFESKEERQKIMGNIENLVRVMVQ